MKLRMAENSLFAILLRSPWWWSALAAMGAFVLVRFFLEPVYALFATTPFVVIGCIAAWRQLRRPSAARVAARLEALQALPWEAFAAMLETGWAAQGYAVARLAGKDAGAADLELVREGRTTLVACRRWKAANAGAEPLRALAAAAEARGADASIYVLAGGLTPQARSFAAEAGITLLEGAELVALTPR